MASTFRLIADSPPTSGCFEKTAGFFGGRGGGAAAPEAADEAEARRQSERRQAADDEADDAEDSDEADDAAPARQTAIAVPRKAAVAQRRAWDTTVLGEENRRVGPRGWPHVGVALRRSQKERG